MKESQKTWTLCDEIRTYTAGIVTVLNQQTSTRLEDSEIVIHVDLTSQADQREVIQAITALRENESAKQIFRYTDDTATLNFTTEWYRSQRNIAARTSPWLMQEVWEPFNAEAVPRSYLRGVTGQTTAHLR